MATDRELSVEEALAEARPVPLWLDTPGRPAPRPPLTGETSTDLLIIGGGFTGLWAAVRAKERNPEREVLLVEGDRVAEHATGRNGGFCEASLTHGEANGLNRWPEEYPLLERLGAENLAGIAATVERYCMECAYTPGGVLAVATRPHTVAALEPGTDGYLDRDAVRGLVGSPTYLAGRLHTESSATVDPARMAWELARVAESLGVRIAENTRVRRLRTSQEGVTAVCDAARVRAGRVVLATNVFTSLLGARSLAVVPAYDHVLATEPLTPEQWESIGWAAPYGITDLGNQFHYYRRTPDNRILWGGYDAIYHFGRGIRPEYEQREQTHQLLARHFFETFPQLAGVRFTHRWGGVIDTCSRFTAFYGVTHGGRVAHAAGFTGLGVGASRFAADVMLDLLAGEDTERTRLRMVRERPVPFPPEPFAWAGIQLTRRAMAREDETGRRPLWLKLLDRLGLGFDS
ncbi:NAD(P)/FAD-dependent oxidoreductase [Streptomyces arenae]|uniref:NAD(P)/FAD-dependent oxidoreductase n=1 Tax=Streptomyces arenae TaxID=29301 RepID=UPI00265AA443|nr:FAD-dependent oxidoreductase [Streptomyces arenae]MCG7203691.1 FAD-binding oxidoreductase [Streptomyces arenae]